MIRPRQQFNLYLHHPNIRSYTRTLYKHAQYLFFQQFGATNFGHGLLDFDQRLWLYCATLLPAIIYIQQRCQVSCQRSGTQSSGYGNLIKGQGKCYLWSMSNQRNFSPKVILVNGRQFLVTFRISLLLLTSYFEKYVQFLI